jgi:hypothetical protein
MATLAPRRNATYGARRGKARVAVTTAVRAARGLECFSSGRTAAMEGAMKPTRRAPGGAAPQGVRTSIEKLLCKQRELERLANHFETGVERVDRIAKDLEDLVATWLSTADVDAVPALPRPAPAEAHVLQEEARAGASALDIRWNDDGSAEVRVNGGRAFRLQHRPALLLSIVAAPGGHGGGVGQVGWRSYEEVAHGIAKADGRPVKRDDVTQTLFKLRRAFRAAEQNWFLIQSDRRGQVRFALRAGAAHVVSPVGSAAVDAE